MTDLELMQSIKVKWGATIDIAAQNSTVPAEFFSALTANESGGDPNAHRVEKNVLASLWQVLMGRAPAYGTIAGKDLVAHVTGFSGVPATVPRALPADAFNRLDDLATSWGLVQIMGYHALEQGITIEELKSPQGNLDASLFLLADFSRRFDLVVTRDFEQLFRCWNTGRPDGQTFDPQYVPNGLARMALWRSLA